MQSIILSLLAALLAISATDPLSAAENEWTNIGLYSDSARVLAFDPHDPAAFYAGTPAGVFRTEDGGATWVNAGLIGWTVVSIAFDPQHPGTLYAATYGNGSAEPASNHAFKTTDGGITWIPADSGLPPQWSCCVELLPIPPQDAAALYAFAGFPRLLLFRSPDGGANWFPTAPLGPSLYFMAAVVDPRNSDIVYAAGQGSDRAGNAVVSVFKSIDGGATWREANSGLPGPQNGSSYFVYTAALAIDPKNPATLYVTKFGIGVYKSTDGAATWHPANFGLPASCCLSGAVVDPRNPDTLYAAGMGPTDLIYRSTNGGAAWRAAGSLRVSAIQRLDFDLEGTIYLTLYNGRIASTDGGATWHSAAFAIRSSPVYSLGFDPQSPGAFYAGAYKTTDAGANWSAPNASFAGPVTALAIDPQGAVYAGITEAKIEDGDPVPCGVSSTSGIFKSVDGGANWADAQAGVGCISAIAIDPLNPATIYAASRFRGVYNSTDAGSSWHPIYTGISGDPATLRINALAVDAVGPGALYVATDGGTFKTTDWGASWSGTGLSGESHALAFDPQDTGTLYAATSTGLLTSTDGGASWLNLLESDVYAVAVNPKTPGALFAGTDDGVVASTDGGENWTPLTGSPGFVRVLALDPQDTNTFYAAGPGGLFRSHLPASDPVSPE